MGRDTSYQKERDANDQPITLTITTRVPSKWRFVDLETGEVWRWDPEKLTGTGRGTLKLATPGRGSCHHHRRGVRVTCSECER